MTNPAHPGRMLFVNIPVADLERSKAFFATLGFSYDPMFTDETAACMLVGKHAFVMLLSREKLAEFAKLPIADPHHARWRCTASACHPAMRSIRSAPLRSRRVAPRTTASCTHAASSTSTATAGRSCGWIRWRRSISAWPSLARIVRGRSLIGGSQIPRMSWRASSTARSSSASSRPADAPSRCGSITVVCSTRTWVSVPPMLILGRKLAGRARVDVGETRVVLSPRNSSACTTTAYCAPRCS